MVASFTVGVPPVWGEFFEFGFPVQVVVEGCCVRLVLLVAGVSAGFWRARMPGGSAAGGLRLVR